MASDINAGDADCLSYESCFEDAITLYKDGNLNEALENFRFLADNRLDITNPEIAGIPLFMAGHIMEELGLDGAELYLEQVISVYPLIGDYALFKSAEIVERRSGPAEAAELYKTIYDSYPDSGLQKKALLRGAKAYLTAGNTKEARESYRTFLKVYPKDIAVPDALYSIGMSYMQDSNDADAQEFFTRLWLYHPVSKEARSVKTMIRLPLSAENIYKRGESLYGAGYYEDAIDEYKQFLLLKKGVSKTKKKEAFFKIGMSYSKLRMLSESEESLEFFLNRYPYDDKTPEAVYWLGRNYLRRGKEDAFIASSIGFLKNYKKNERYPEVLYRLGNIYAERNDVDTAVSYLERVMKDYPFSSYASDSLWKKGWILYKAGNFDGALHVFNNIINDPGEHAYTSQAIYWRAKVLEKTGDYQAMNEGICRLCSDYGRSFYCLFSGYYYDVACSSENTHPHSLDFSQDRPSPLPEGEDDQESEQGFSGETVMSRSSQRIMKIPLNPPFSKGEIRFPPLEKGGEGGFESGFSGEKTGGKSPEDQSLARIRLFIYLGFRDEALIEILRLRNEINDDKDKAIMLASILSSLGEYHRAMYTVRPYIPSNRSDNGYDTDNRLWPLIYPAGYSDLIDKYAVRNNLDPFLVNAIIREESWFNKEAVSPAGALGLMQLMPGTAKRMAKESYAGRESLFDPEVNIELGTRFFAERLKQFDGNIFLAIASYNAGPEAVEKWITERDGVELDEFIEDIPYKETREYVKKVFRSYMEYHRLNKENTRIDTL
ncbi:MAG: transglycosylase SLT domain-containing protein [Nitrospirota bacterium]